MAGKTGVDVSLLRSATVNFDYSPYTSPTSMNTKSELVLLDGTIYTGSGWRPGDLETERPEDMIPGTDLKWPDEYLNSNRPNRSDGTSQ
jgi:hypothetical protein